jgi:uncharacterized protein YigA (DUF484 family)
MSGPREKKRQGASPAATTSALSEADVRSWLKAHPSFLIDNPDIFDALVPKRRHGDGVVDMHGFLIDRLRNENADVKERQAELLAVSRANLSGQNRIHTAALALLEVRSFNQLIEVVMTDLAVHLEVDVVKLAVENENGIAERTVRGIRLLEPGDVDRLMGDGKDVVLNPTATGRREIYGSARGLVHSEALLRLHASPEAPTGLLALASRYEGRFDPSRGTELLGFLGRILEVTIRTWLGLPRS